MKAEGKGEWKIMGGKGKCCTRRTRSVTKTRNMDAKQFPRPRARRRKCWAQKSKDQRLQVNRWKKHRRRTRQKMSVADRMGRSPGTGRKLQELAIGRHDHKLIIILIFLIKNLINGFSCLLNIKSTYKINRCQKHTKIMPKIAVSDIVNACHQYPFVCRPIWTFTMITTRLQLNSWEL